MDTAHICFFFVGWAIITCIAYSIFILLVDIYLAHFSPACNAQLEAKLLQTAHNSNSNDMSGVVQTNETLV